MKGEKTHQRWCDLSSDTSLTSFQKTELVTKKYFALRLLEGLMDELHMGSYTPGSSQNAAKLVKSPCAAEVLGDALSVVIETKVSYQDHHHVRVTRSTWDVESLTELSTSNSEGAMVQLLLLVARVASPQTARFLSEPLIGMLECRSSDVASLAVTVLGPLGATVTPAVVEAARRSAYTRDKVRDYLIFMLPLIRHDYPTLAQQVEGFYQESTTAT